MPRIAWCILVILVVIVVVRKTLRVSQGFSGESIGKSKVSCTRLSKCVVPQGRVNQVRKRRAFYDEPTSNSG